MFYTLTTIYNLIIPQKKYPIRGLDISHHQGVIDWDLLKKEGFTFVFIKASEGGDYKDPLFDINWKEASRIEILKGAYHFFTFCRSGNDQALNFISTVPLEPDSLSPVIDFEFSGNCSKRPIKDKRKQNSRSKKVNEIFHDNMELGLLSAITFHDSMEFWILSWKTFHDNIELGLLSRKIYLIINGYGGGSEGWTGAYFLINL